MTRAVLAALVLAGVLSGCSGSAEGLNPDSDPAPSAEVIRSYVALGDSFTAAPFVPGTAFAEGCLRSSGNYPTLLADELDAKLRDVSCSAAATADVEGRQPTRYGNGKSLPPQIDAVRRGTDLVTVGIGGNDQNLFQTLVQECTGPGAACTELLGDSAGDVLDKVGSGVTGVLEAVQAKAPRATVVLVGYPRLVGGSCPAMPIAESELSVVAGLEARLNRTLAGAARAAGAEYVDMYSVSEGHEVCSDDPWVNGKVTDQQRALAFHPFPEGQQAVADELLALLSSD